VADWRGDGMKIKGDFMLREIAGQSIVVPLGHNVVSVNGIITLTESAVILWKILENGVSGIDELTDALLNEYDVDCETALCSVEEFIGQLREKDMID